MLLSNTPNAEELSISSPIKMNGCMFSSKGTKCFQAYEYSISGILILKQNIL